MFSIFDYNFLSVKFKFIFFLIVFSFLPYLVNAQEYNFRKYNVEDGLAQSQVYSICQDKRGFLWLGTRGGGISVFNGTEFINYTEKDGLPSNYINDLQTDSLGNIWIATTKGLAKYDGNKFFKFNKENGIEPINITDLSFISNTLFCASNTGIFQLKNSRLEEIKLPETYLNKSINSIVAVSKSKIWFATNEGLFLFENGKVKEFSKESKFMKNAITTLEFKDKVLWIGTYGDGLYKYTNNEFSRIDYGGELKAQTVLDIYKDKNEILWIATLKKGVLHYDLNTKRFTEISEKEGLSNNHVRKIFEDYHGSIWFGTSGGGVSQYLGKQFTFYDEQSGLDGRFIYSVFKDDQNKIWVGNAQNGVSVIENGLIINYNKANGFASVKVKAIAQDNEGTMWFGTDGSGVFVFKNQEFIAIKELEKTYVKQIILSRKGHIFIATAGNGIIEISIKNGNYLIEKWTVKEGLLSNRITSLFEDENGNLWYGSESHGVACFTSDNKSDKRFSIKNGLSSDIIRCLSGTKDLLFVGTAGGGVDCINTSSLKKLFNLNQKNGLSSENIYLLSATSPNNLIIGTEKGLDYVSFNENLKIQQIKNYGKQEGFTGVETCQNAVFTDQNSVIWIGTIHGLCKFDLAELVKNVKPPILSFTNIRQFYESILDNNESLLRFGKPLKRMNFAYNENHLSFEFIGVNLKNPLAVEYRWKLKGFDNDWSPLSNSHNIVYSNLNSGEYTFLLTAINEDGIRTEKPLEFSFTIATPFWKTTWFIILVIVLSITILFLFYKYQASRIRFKARKKQEELEVEKEFLELEQKALRLQMNPHFIFNALNSIQSLIGSGKEKEARYYLAKFSRLMRQILDNSRKNEITLEEEINTLENYLLVERFCNADKFTYEILAENLETDFIKIPPMMLQPFVENAIKHGMKGLENKTGKIIISFKEFSDYLECIIEDNGIGREKAAEINSSSKETYHESTSLKVTKERLELLNTNSEMQSLLIIDLYDNNNIASGTKIILKIPIIENEKI